MNKNLLIVDDDTPFRERLTRSMTKKGFIVESFSKYHDGLNRFNEVEFHYAIIDMRLEDGSGLELIKKIKQISPLTKSLLLTGYGNIATAVAAIKKGLVEKKLNIHFNEGSIQIEYEDEILMTGPVSEIEKIKLDI